MSRIELRLAGIYFCPGRMVAEYHLSNGQILFCEPLNMGPGKWFKEFNTAEAEEMHRFSTEGPPGLVYEDGKMEVVPREQVPGEVPEQQQG